MTMLTIQPSLFEREEPTPAPAIPGLSYLPGYLGAAQETTLLTQVGRQSWNTDWKRRVQHYGSRYHARTFERRGDLPREPLPDWLAEVAWRLRADGHFQEIPDQAIVNEYLPGQGIAPHLDIPESGEQIASISLGSPCVMDFIQVQTGEKKSLLLEPRSLLLLSGEARHMWKHGIAGRKTDRIHGMDIQRRRRVSLTFRKTAIE